jgi:uncharacterized membrane protein
MTLADWPDVAVIGSRDMGPSHVLFLETEHMGETSDEGQDGRASQAASPRPVPRYRSRLPGFVQARPRLFIGLGCGIAVGFLLPSDWRVATRLLIAWNVATWLYFALASVLMATASQETLRKKATIEDDGRFVILILTALAALAAMGAIVAHLATVKDTTGIVKNMHVSLAVATIVSAWIFIHLMFSLHYAHDYFFERVASGGRPAKKVGGLTFPGTKDPDYLDFLYFSFVIGVACQTADVVITSQGMRRTALAHCVLAFFFNSAVLALTINIAAGLI